MNLKNLCKIKDDAKEVASLKERLEKQKERLNSILSQYDAIEKEHTRLQKNKKTYSDDKLGARSRLLGHWLQSNRDEFLHLNNLLGYYIPKKFEPIEKYDNKEYAEKADELLTFVESKSVADLQSKIDKTYTP